LPPIRLSSKDRAGLACVPSMLSIWLAMGLRFDLKDPPNGVVAHLLVPLGDISEADGDDREPIYSESDFVGRPYGACVLAPG
jgi:hypothetical protein